MTRTTVPVALGERRYDIVIGRGALSEAKDRLSMLVGEGQAAIVADLAALSHHAAAIAELLPGAPVIGLPAGERSKGFSEYERVSEALLDAGVGRDGVVVAFGGGVTGDLAGFCAATLRRGCRFVQIPTTLLAQVDSSVGGKTAINTAAGKNLVGAFHQPALVIADLALLDTLPAREWRAGYAEVVKYALLGDAAFFEILDETGADILAGKAAPLAHAVAHSCRMKADIVAEDERESGRRALLNLGHTFGHALEAAAGYDGRLLHGEGVAIGMAMAARYSGRRGLCGEDVAARTHSLLLAAGLPTVPAAIPALSATADDLLTLMYQDKKVEGGALTLILLRAIGEAFVAKNEDPAPLLDFLRDDLTLAPPTP